MVLISREYLKACNTTHQASESPRGEIASNEYYRADYIQSIKLELASPEGTKLELSPLHEKGGDREGADAQNHAICQLLSGNELIENVQVGTEQPNQSVQRQQRVKIKQRLFQM